jgi:uncharacterized damage-inducible protein DinB
MNTLEYCLIRRKAEMASFVRVLKAIPQGRLDYRPDPRSRTAGALAWVIVSDEATLVELLDKGTIEWKEQPVPPTVSDIVAAYERQASALIDRLSRLDEEGWQKTGRFVMQGAPPWEEKVSEFVWLFLFDAIHHRGQLSVYLRLMGSKVPSIYGPSGDDPGGS